MPAPHAQELVAASRVGGYDPSVTTVASTPRPTGLGSATTPSITALEAKPDKLAPLAPQEIAERLTGLPSRVAEQVFKLVEAQVTAETGRQQRIDAKATALLTAIGLSITVAFGFGAVLVKNGWTGQHAHVFVCSVFVVVVLAGAWSAVEAIRALKVTAYSGVHEDAIFSRAILDRVREEARDVGEYPGDDAAKRAAAESTALAQYQMSMTLQLWAIVVKLRQNHAKKTPLVKSGQIALIVFVGAFAVLLGIMVAAS